MVPSPRTAISPEHIDDWIEAFRGPLIGLVASWRDDWRSAEELAQDTFAEAWIGRYRFRGDPEDLDAVGAWLRGIAFHLHSADRRAGERRHALPLEESDEALPLPVEDENAGRRTLLARAFARLSAPHQTVLRMHYLEQTSALEVAALLGVTAKAVEGRLYQARKALRAHVERAERRQLSAETSSPARTA